MKLQYGEPLSNLGFNFTLRRYIKEYGSTEPLNRVKKEMLKEVKAMAKGERVLIVGGDLHSFPFPLNLSLLCPFPLN